MLGDPPARATLEPCVPWEDMAELHSKYATLAHEAAHDTRSAGRTGTRRQLDVAAPASRAAALVERSRKNGGKRAKSKRNNARATAVDLVLKRCTIGLEGDSDASTKQAALDAAHAEFEMSWRASETRDPKWKLAGLGRFEDASVYFLSFGAFVGPVCHAAFTSEWAGLPQR